MSGPYELNGGRSVVEVLPRYVSRKCNIGQGPYEPTGIVMETAHPRERPSTRGPYEPARIVRKNKSFEY